MISNKLLNPQILEALADLKQEGLISLNPILEKLVDGKNIDSSRLPKTLA
jgi:hypothetical protein